MSTGAKVLIGCIGVAALGFVGLAVAIGVGGMALKRGMETVVDQADENADATRTLARLTREYPFTAPSSGEVTVAQRERFRAVTEHAWKDMRPWAVEMRSLSENTRQRDGKAPGVRDVIAVTRASTGMLRARPVIARALDAERISIAEYVWIGQALRRESDDALERAVSDDVDAKLVLDLAMTWSTP